MLSHLHPSCTVYAFMMWTSPSTQIHIPETLIISDTAVKILNLTLYGFICYCYLNKIVEIWLVVINLFKATQQVKAF